MFAVISLCIQREVSGCAGETENAEYQPQGQIQQVVKGEEYEPCQQEIQTGLSPAFLEKPCHLGNIFIKEQKSHTASRQDDSVKNTAEGQGAAVPQGIIVCDLLADAEEIAGMQIRILTENRFCRMVDQTA